MSSDIKYLRNFTEIMPEENICPLCNLKNEDCECDKYNCECDKFALKCDWPECICDKCLQVQTKCGCINE